MISIIIPAYNTEDKIESCVNSILEQPFSDIEIIIVNDGSTDNTAKIIDNLSNKVPQIKTIHTKNQGAYNARLVGVKESKGEWITFVDSDDTITPNAIDNLFKYASDGNDIIIGTISINNTRIFKHQIIGHLSSNQYLQALLSNQTSIGPCAKLFKRDLFKDVITPEERITVNEDLLLLIYLASKAQKIYITNNIICYNYIFRERSMRTSLMSIEKWTHLFKLIEGIINPINNPNINQAFINFKLIRIKYQMIDRGLYISSHDPLYKDIIGSDLLPTLSKQEYQIVRIMKSPTFQRISHIKYMCHNLCRNILNLIR